MRIAQLAPLIESVPPSLYGGTERVIATLCDELVAHGHAVTLFASGDSQTRAELVPIVPQGLRLAGMHDALPAHLRAVGLVAARARDFDVIHSHVDLAALPIAGLLETPVVQTLHGRLDLPGWDAMFEQFRDAALVSISDNQRQQVEHWNWFGTVYNGIDLRGYSFHPEPGGYLAFLGRICPDKGIEEAIQVAELTGMPLKIAAKVDPMDREYYERRVRPLFGSPDVEYVGEIGESEKDAFLGEALALLFPISWPEPFGLVMVEAMATGTPVIASRYGSVPEVLSEGRTGFICDSVPEMVRACRNIQMLRREDCRAHVEAHFAAAQMATGYEMIYQLALRRARKPSSALRPPLVLDSRNGRRFATDLDRFAPSATTP